MMLSEINFDDIEIGLDVLSCIGNHGKVIKKTKEGPGYGNRYDNVTIQWDNGTQSNQFLMCMDKVKVINND